MKVFVRVLPPLVLLCISFGFSYAGPFDNCEEYIKYGIPGTTGEPLCRKGFALAHHSERKTAETSET